MKDLALAEAYVIYMDSLCACGHSSFLAHDDFNSGEFELREDVFCLACAERESEHAKGVNLEPGQKQYVANLMGSDVDE